MGGAVSIPALGMPPEDTAVTDRADTPDDPGRDGLRTEQHGFVPADGPAPGGHASNGIGRSNGAAGSERVTRPPAGDADLASAPVVGPGTGGGGDAAGRGPAAQPPLEGDQQPAAAGLPAANTAKSGRRVIRAGRDLPAAIAVGIVLGAVILVPLFTFYPIWVGVVSAAVAIGTYEVVRALHVAGMTVPLVPLAAGAVAMPVAAYGAGTNGLVLALAGTILAAVAVRGVRDPTTANSAARLRDFAACAFTAAYVGFPAGFATLLTSAPDGHWRTIAFLGTVVASDIGGYTAGVLSGGRHKLAPSVSPGKSWEGFAGSIVGCVIVGAVLMTWPLDGEIWQGALLGVATACSATVGDLGESLLKRDIGIKDMGSLLPGHGGIMDRLDSLLCTAPVAWLLITAFLG
ncbi:phosphatidate cytidylyltransferase [Parafrankia irregularis]|uniref:Phosphatidate cytidylyltransferase n=1 Tax=Parafrankia irregularis TaxID=795642 RepID=A0A0S4QJC9_9ACTN|nr:phosphatidate cytidylyltransferase [Parafrankia sp. CH37]MBE3205439.1 phosphatidate cytidylyltransferase [Parafrankia sp. CH37]CUU55665.1 phosphatidate cytidylyltransferase [Parafrankia irregularis]